MKTILAFTTLHVPDYTSACDYFVNILGFEPTEERPGATAFIQASGSGLAIREDKTIVMPLYTGTTIYFIVSDLKKYYQQLTDRGADIVEPLHNMPFGETFTVKTPDGHRLGFYEA